MILDWKAIRPLNGSQAEGFQELCVQLARTEIPTNTEFVQRVILTPESSATAFWTMVANGAGKRSISIRWDNRSGRRSTDRSKGP